MVLHFTSDLEVRADRDADSLGREVRTVTFDQPDAPERERGTLVISTSADGRHAAEVMIVTGQEPGQFRLGRVSSGQLRALARELLALADVQDVTAHDSRRSQPATAGAA